MSHISMFFKSGDTVAHCIVASEHKEALEKLGLSDAPEKAKEIKKTTRTTRSKKAD